MPPPPPPPSSTSTSTSGTTPQRPAAATSTPATSPSPSPLTTLLPAPQRRDLIKLIAGITDSMLARLDASFKDVPAPAPASAAPPSLTTTTATTTTTPTIMTPTRTTTAGTATTVTNESHNRPPAYSPPAGPADPIGMVDLVGLRRGARRSFHVWRDGVVVLVVDAAGVDDAGVAGTVAGRSGDAAAVEVVVEQPPHPQLPPDYDELFGPPPTTTQSASLLPKLYPPISTPLSSLPRSTRSAVLSAVLLLLLSAGHYAAPSRILLLHLLSSLHLPLQVLQDDELRLARGLLEVAKRMSADEETRKRSQENAVARRWKVGLAGVAGAALIGVTGGLAAPLVAGAIGSVMGGLGLGATAAAGLLGTLGSSGVIVGSLFGAYGYGMTSKMMDQYAREVEDFGFLPMRKSRARTQGGGVRDVRDVRDAREVPADERRLRVTIGVSGWLTERGDVMRPWRVMGPQSEVFALRWELDALLDMGKSLESMVSSAVWAVASREIIARTVFASLMFAMWPIALLKLSKVVDNPFNVAKSRADKAGLVLADAIINKAQGERPVTLIGYSMGARLIYSCLMSLAERRAFGLVESAVLIGAPAPSDTVEWRTIRSVVSGRLVNAYSEKDYVLAFLYRTSSIQLGVAGLEAVGGVEGVESVNVSSIVSGHLRYPHLVGTILERIGWEDLNLQEVEREQHIVDTLDEEEQKKTAERNDEAARKMEESRTQTHIQSPPVNRVAHNDTRPAIPSRPGTSSPGIGSSHDPLGARDDLTASTDTQTEEALTTMLARHVEQEGAQRFRCRVQDCQKLFKTEHFWKKHLGMRHAEWLQGLKQEIHSAAEEAAAAAIENNTPKGEEHAAAPMLQRRASSASEEEEDLISFDDPPPEEPPKALPKDVEPRHNMTNFPERQGEQRVTMEAPVEQPQVVRVQDEGLRHEVESSDDEGSQGITMIDNDESEITLLEPIPWTEDEETPQTSRQEAHSRLRLGR